MRNILLVDSCFGSGFSDMELTESTRGGLMAFRGKFQEADAVNKNKRIYPFSILDENVKRIMEMVRGRRLVGELDHPSDSIVHLTTASHVVTKLWWEGNTLMGEGEILRTPHGKVLRALIEDGIPIGISSRGVGNGKVNENGILVIGESFKLITFDAVADPSTHEAFQERIVRHARREHVELKRPEAKRRLFTRSSNYEVKNESQCIDNASDLLIACLRGVVVSQVDQYKARLK